LKHNLTTLLSQVDSSVGGKTGVNHALGKNMIGSFYQPKCVVIDVDTLDTLDNQQYSAGLAEVIKYGLLGNADFFTYLHNEIGGLMARDKDLIIEVVLQSCSDKADIVTQDELEAGKRALLLMLTTWLPLAYPRQLLLRVDKHHSPMYFQSHAQRYSSKIDYQDFIDAMSVDKKVIGGEVRLVLMKKMGQAFISNDYQQLLRTIEDIFLPIFGSID
jgi:3-dehydroquinate synthase